MGRDNHRKDGSGQIDFDEDGPVVAAELIGDLLDIPAEQVSHQIRQGTITTLYEAGVDDHEGGFRLSFFHRNRRGQLEVDRNGRVFTRTVIDFGDKPLPASMRGPEPAARSKQQPSGNR